MRKKFLLKNYQPYAFVFPAFLVLICLALFPALYNLFSSLCIEKGGIREFVGLQNYKELFADPAFRRDLGTTLIYCFTDAFGSTLLGLTAALICVAKYPGQGAVRVAVILPWVVPYVVVGIVWRWILHPMGGYMPNILEFLHLDPDLFSLNAKDTALSGVLLASIWRGFPFVGMMLMASLQSVDNVLYEAAEIDGASKWQSLFRVTIPIIAPTLAMVFILRLIWAANQFDLLFMMTSGGPQGSTETMAYYIYKNSFEFFEYERGAAASIIQLLLFMLICTPYIARTRKELED